MSQSKIEEDPKIATKLVPLILCEYGCGTLIPEREINREGRDSMSMVIPIVENLCPKGLKKN